MQCIAGRLECIQSWSAASCILSCAFGASKRMIPFLHLGHFEIPTFGLMVAIALFASAYVLQADFNRRKLNVGRRDLVER